MPLFNPPDTKTSIGLGNVDNTSDASKPVSTATQTALDAKVSTISSSNVSRVNTSQTTTSTTYVGLTTAQTVTITVPASGCVMVMVSTYASNSNAGVSCYASFALSGGNTLASADANGTEYITSDANYRDRRTATTILTGLTPGSTTFTMQFRTGANTATFRDRELAVIPL